MSDLVESTAPGQISLIDSSFAARRLFFAFVAMMMGCSAMYVVAVALPEMESEFGVTRGEAAIPYTVMMVGFGLGGIILGRWADRFGLRRVLVIGAAGVFLGYSFISVATSFWQVILAHGLFLGFMGCASAFSPLVADTSLWWKKHRGIAVAICACGNYTAGAVWPHLTQLGIELIGWRDTYFLLGIISSFTMLTIAQGMRHAAPRQEDTEANTNEYVSTNRPFNLTPNQATALLWMAGLSCCIAMAMPQVHIVSYCSDLGFGAARGAEMLSLMLGFGVLSRLLFGLISDRIGGLRTLIIASSMQLVALACFIPFDGLVSLYVVSIIFGLFQGGIVPAYAIIIREHFASSEVGLRVGAVMMATQLGMALGGWSSGAIYDVTGSYLAAFIHGVSWNSINLAIGIILYFRFKRRPN